MASKVCDNCSSSGKSPASVPYAAFESSMSRAERIIKRLVIALIVTIALTFASNIGLLIATMPLSSISIIALQPTLPFSVEV